SRAASRTRARRSTRPSRSTAPASRSASSIRSSSTPKESASMPERRSALSEVLRPGLSGAESAPGPGVTIAALAPLALVQVAAFDLPRAEAALGAAFGLAPPERNRAAEAGERRLLWCGAERWLAVEPETRDLASQLRAALPSDVAAVTDLSHARTVLRLEGSAVRTLLAKLGQLDFDPAAFATGATAQTQL